MFDFLNKKKNSYKKYSKRIVCRLLDKSRYSVYLEASTPELEDVVRLEDRYRRV